MKKGFTLVELLAVLAILSILGIIGGISIFGIIGNVQKQSLEDGLKSLQEVSITYVQNKKVYLSACSSDFDPKNPTLRASNQTCYQTITLQNILDEKLFEPKGLRCHPEKKIVVYREKKGNYTEIKSYLAENICEI